MVRSKNLSHELDGLHSLLDQLWLVGLLWGVEISTVATVVTISHGTDLVDPVVRLEFGGPLPWVFSTVGDEYVGASGVMACKLSNGSLDLEIDAIDVMAVVLPVGLI